MPFFALFLEVVISSFCNADWLCFQQEVFTEIEKYGEVEEMNVCDNLGDHLVRNV